MKEQNMAINKLLGYLAITAVVCIIIALWNSYFFYEMYTHASNGVSMSLIARAIFLPLGIWMLFFCGAILAWFKKWRWFIWVPLLLTYPYIFNELDILFSTTSTVGQWYWTVKLSALSKVVFYGLSLCALYLLADRKRMESKISPDRIDTVQRYIAVIAVISIIMELWAVYSVYSIYASEGYRLSRANVERYLFLPAGIWFLFTGGAILAWFKKWRWFVCTTLLLIYPGMFHQLFLLHAMLAAIAHWYWVFGLNAICKLILYCLSIYGICLYMWHEQ